MYRIHALILFLIISFSGSAKDNITNFLNKLDNELTWDLPKHFKKIDWFIKQPIKPEEKIKLYLIKYKYNSKLQNIKKCKENLNSAFTLLDKVPCNDSLKATLNLKLASCFAAERDFMKSYKYYVKANNHFVLTNNHSGLAYSYITLSNLVGQLNQKESSLMYLKKAEKQAILSRDEEIIKFVYLIYSTYWSENQNINKSFNYIKKYETLDSKDEYDFILEYTKAELFRQRGDDGMARLLYFQMLKEAEKRDCKAFLGIINYGIGLTYITSDKDKSYEYILKSLKIINQSDPDLIVFICDCVLNEFPKDKHQKLIPFFKNKKKENFEKITKDKEIQIGNLFEFSLDQNDKILKEKQRNEKILKAKNSQNILLVVLSFVAVLSIILLIYFIKVLKSKKERELLITNEFNKQKTLLNQTMISFTNLNSVLDSLESKIKKIALEQTSKKLSDELYALAKQVDEKTVGLKSKELKDLDLIIQSINDGFVKNLCEKYSELTSYEISLSIYLRMNFSSKQIAELKGTTENSIDVSRSRLRKKLGIHKENIDLVNFLNKI